MKFQAKAWITQVFHFSSSIMNCWSDYVHIALSLSISLPVWLHLFLTHSFSFYEVIYNGESDKWELLLYWTKYNNQSSSKQCQDFFTTMSNNSSPLPFSLILLLFSMPLLWPETAPIPYVCTGSAPGFPESICGRICPFSLLQVYQLELSTSIAPVGSEK